MILSINSENDLILHISDEIRIENYFKLERLKVDLMDRFEMIESMQQSYCDLLIKVDINYYEEIKTFISELNIEVSFPSEIELIEIPVCYSEYALDKEVMIKHTGLSWEEIVEHHTSSYYFVYFLGFTLGFPYLGGLDERIQAPRKDEPRLKIEAGSVGIAGSQTGIYPSALPGGWQIIGKTPVELYDHEGSTLLKPGQVVKFVACDDIKACVKRQVILWPF